MNGPLYVAACPTQYCKACQRNAEGLREYPERKVILTPEDGIPIRLLITVDSRPLNLNSQNSGIVHIPCYARTLSRGPPAENPYVIRTSEDAEGFYTKHSVWVMENYLEASVEDKVAEFRRVSPSS